MKASEGRLTAEAAGEIESDDGVLVLKRIHVVYSLRLDPDADRAKAQRAFEHHMPFCPIYRSIREAIEITTALELVEA
ncbi:MAG: OsmC family protein [Actinobacteria bacterium]|nr:OsmC family protein [Actinomycetota bacterium]